MTTTRRSSREATRVVLLRAYGCLLLWVACVVVVVVVVVVVIVAVAVAVAVVLVDGARWAERMSQRAHRGDDHAAMVLEATRYCCMHMVVVVEIVVVVVFVGVAVRLTILSIHRFNVPCVHRTGYI